MIKDGQEHLSAWNASLPDKAEEYWVVGHNMRIVAMCRKAEDCVQIETDHNRMVGMLARADKLVALSDKLETQLAQRIAEAPVLQARVKRAEATIANVVVASDRWRRSPQTPGFLVQMLEALEHARLIIPEQKVGGKDG